MKEPCYLCHQIFMLFYKTYSFSTEWAEYQDFPIFFVSYEETNGYLLDKDHRQQKK